MQIKHIRGFSTRALLQLAAFILCLCSVTVSAPSHGQGADQPANTATPPTMTTGAPAPSQSVAPPNGTKADPPATQNPLPKPLTISILIGITLVLVFGLATVLRALRRCGWNLCDALSEEAELPDGTPPPAAGAPPPLVPSSSRVIALIGTIVLSTFFVGIGYWVIWQLCNGQPITEAQDVWSFFATGSTLFLPYGINKLSSIGK